MPNRIDPEALVEVPQQVHNSSDTSPQGSPSTDQMAQLERLWQHAIHEDNNFMQRGNFFLVGHSMFVVAYAALISAPDSSTATTAARVIAGFGLAFAVVWAYANHRQVRYLRVVARRTFEAFPEFQATRPSRRRQPSSTSVIAYVTPVLGAAMWAILGLVA